MVVAFELVRSRIAASTSFSFFPKPQPYPHFEDVVDFFVPVIVFPRLSLTDAFISFSPPAIKDGTSSYFSESVRKVKLSASLVRVEVGE